MNISSNIYRKAKRGLAAAAILASATSCSWISEDLEPCPTGLYLRFVYDYNMMRSDVFRDHVGEVTAYVFDSDNKLVTMQTENNPSAWATYGYEMRFDDLQSGNYRVIATAFQRKAEEREQRPGAKFRYPALEPGDPIEKLEMRLDRRQTADGYAVDHQNRPLDTLWMSYQQHCVEVKDQEITREKVGLMRDTKNLTISLHQLDDPADIDCLDFDIRLTDRNGRFSYDNSPLPDERLTYSPYAEWNTDFRDGEGTVVQRTAHADLSYPRVMYHEEERQKNARLTIYNKRSQKLVADIDLPDYLAQGRSSQESHYSPQEFLDREHIYKLDFFLKGDTWEYVELRISVLDWAMVRIDNISL